MLKVLSFITIMLLIISYCTGSFALNMNLENNSTADNLVNEESNNKLSTNDEGTRNSTGTSTTTQVTVSTQELTISNSLSICLIAIGIVIILLAIAILVKLKK